MTATLTEPGALVSSDPGAAGHVLSGSKAPQPEPDYAALSVRMRPSEYTAALLRVIEQRSPALSIRRTIDIGTGSGVLLAALAHSGATDLWGVDVDPDALRLARALLASEAPGVPVTLLNSHLWNGVPALRFDAVVANLPHYPADVPLSPGRNPSWSGGGRRLLDDFLVGLADHLAPGGVAWITHHALAGLDVSKAMLTRHGLVAEVVLTWTVYEPGDRVAALSPAVIAAERPRSLRCIAGYHFVDSHVLEIRRAGDPVATSSPASAGLQFGSKSSHTGTV